MSAAARQAIADAASTVAGVNCSPYFRQSTKTGDAVVRFDRMTTPTSFGPVTWQVVVWLPADQAAAEKWIDSKTPDLIDALRDELAIQSIQTVPLAMSSGTALALVIEGNREPEE